MANKTLEFLITAKETASPVINSVSAKFKELERIQQTKIAQSADAVQGELLDKQLRAQGEHLRADLIKHQEYYDKRITMAGSAAEREALAQIEELERVQMIRKAQLEQDAIDFERYEAFKEELLAKEAIAVEATVAKGRAARTAATAEEAEELTLLQSMRANFGRGSALGMTALALKGAGPLMAIGVGAMLLKGVGDGFAKIREDSEDIHKNWANMVQDFMESIPILGDVAKAAEGIEEAITGRRGKFKHEQENEALHEAGLKALGEQKELEATSRMSAKTSGMTDEQKKEFDIHEHYSNTISQATKARNEAISDLNARYDAISPSQRAGDVQREFDKREAEIDESLDRTIKEADKTALNEMNKLGEIRGKMWKKVFSGVGEIFAEIGEKTLKGGTEEVAKVGGGVFGLFSALAGKRSPGKPALMSTELPTGEETNLSGAAQAARERLDVMNFERQGQRERIEQEHAEAIKAHNYSMKNFSDKITDAVGNFSTAVNNFIKTPASANFPGLFAQK